MPGVPSKHYCLRPAQSVKVLLHDFYLLGHQLGKLFASLYVVSVSARHVKLDQNQLLDYLRVVFHLNVVQ